MYSLVNVGDLQQQASSSGHLPGGTAPTPDSTSEQKGVGQPLRSQGAFLPQPREYESFQVTPSPSYPLLWLMKATLAQKCLRAQGIGALAGREHPSPPAEAPPALPASLLSRDLVPAPDCAYLDPSSENSRAIEAAPADAVEVGRATEPHVNTLLIFFFFLQMVQFRKSVSKLCLAETRRSAANNRHISGER